MALDQAALRWVQKYAPALQWGTEHFFQLTVVLDDDEAGTGVVAVERGCEIGGVHRLRWRITIVDDLLVRLARHVQEEGFVGFDGQPRRYRFQARLVADAENFSHHLGGDAEAQQLPSLELPEDAWLVGGRRVEWTAR